MKFASPHYFYFLLLLIPLIGFYIFRELRPKESLVFSELKGLKKLPGQDFLFLRHSIIVLRVAGLSLLIVALARPQEEKVIPLRPKKGIDIMLALDVSTSMKALDFTPKNRLHVAKSEIKNFISKRKTDRVGLVLFAGESFVKCPVTLDYKMLKDMVDEVDFHQIPKDGTAIGTALATAALRLDDSEAQSRIIILLTDGANNAGKISPEQAAKEAAKLGIKIYTIAVGKKGLVDYPVQYTDFSGRPVTRIRQIESDIDEEILDKIAILTGGESFRAQNAKELEKIYDMINRLEKTDIDIPIRTKKEEQFYIYLLLGFILLMIDFLLSNTRYRRVP